MTFIKRHWFGLLFIAGTLARLPQMFAPLWYDESWTQWVSGLPFDRMMAAVAGDVHPPLFFVLTWLVGRVSLAPFVLRLVPLAFSLLSALAAKRLAEALHLPQAAQLVAMLLMALSPWQLYYSAELRMYSLLEFCFVVGALAILRRNWLLMALAMIGLMYTQNYGFIFCFVLGLWALWLGRKEVHTPILFGALALLAYLPWGVTGLRSQLVTVAGGYWITAPTLPDVLLTVYDWLFGSVEGGLEVLGMGLTVWLILTIVLRREDELQWLTFAPVVIAIIPSLWRPLYISRALLPCSITFYLLVGKVLSSVRLPRRVVAAGFMIPVVALAAVTDNGRGLMVGRYHITDVANFLDRARPGDAIYHLGLASMIELHQFDLPERQYLWPYPMGIQTGSYSLATRQALGIDETPLADIPEHHVWVVVPINGYGGYLADIRPRVEELLEDYPGRQVLDTKGKYDFGVEVYELWR